MVTLILTLVFAACGNGSTGGGKSTTPVQSGGNLSGIYINIGSSSVPDALEFTSASAVTYHRYTMTYNNSYPGTYTVSGNTVTCTFSYNNQAVIYSYTISNNNTRLTVASSSGPISANVGVTLDKKTKRSDLADFAGTWKSGANTVAFTGNNFTYTNSGDSSLNANGTFTAYEDVIVLKNTTLDVWVSGVYTMTATQITISKGTMSYIDGTYTKVAEFDYITNADGTVEITGYNGSGGAVSIPSTLGGKTVTRIGHDSLQNRSFTSITIPNIRKTARFT